MQYPILQDPNLVKREVNKMAHMLDSIKSAALQLMKKIRQGFGGKMTDQEINDLFWGDFNLESRRYS